MCLKFGVSEIIRILKSLTKVPKSMLQKSFLTEWMKLRDTKYKVAYF